MKKLILIILICLSNAAFSQITKSEILNRAESYYDSLSSFSIKVREKSKSAIDIQPGVWEYYCYVDRKSKSELFENRKFSYLVTSGNEFSIDNDKASFTAVTKKKKHWIYYQKYSRLPFINFDFIKQEIHKTFLNVVSTDSSYLLKGNYSFYEFRKTNGSISKIYRSGKDETFTGGDYFEEITFDLPASDPGEISGKISFAESIIKTNNRKIIVPAGKLEAFDLTLLSDPELKWSNSNPGSLQGRKVLIDVFFQGCYPCVQSYPYLVELNANKDSNTVIIGIDSVPKDSVTAEEYLKKYHIKYPVLTGKMASQLTEILRVSEWPTMILIDEKGKILLYHKGFSPGIFKRLRKLMD